MFATLDPTLRHVKLPSKREVLLSDTVGFIRHLPHTLVSAFAPRWRKCSGPRCCCTWPTPTSPTAAEQMRRWKKCLRELEVQDKPRLYVMNKIDLLPESKRESLMDASKRGPCVGAKGHWIWTGCWSALTDLARADPVRQVRPRAAVGG